MHIPDGFLSAPVALGCATVSTAGVAAACSRARGTLDSSRGAALTGVAAAFVFAAQTLNFPVAGGTSGHFVGGVLVTALLGPSTAVVIMTAVLILQCFVFGDGGLLALGANVLNMALVQPLVGFAVWRLLACNAPPRGVRVVTALAFASWAGTVAAAASCASELALSQVVSAMLVFPAMVGVHALIGVGEALIAVLVWTTLATVRPDILRPAQWGARETTWAAAFGLAPSLALVWLVSPYACPWPDGLGRVVERLEIRSADTRAWFSAPWRGYVIPGVVEHVLATEMATVAGTLIAFTFCVWLARRLARKGAAGPRPNRPPFSS